MASFHVLPSLNADLAETNALYVNPSDATTPYVKMGRFVYKCIPHPDVARGTVRMNAVARREVYPSEEVTLEEYFVPMTGGPTVVAVQAEFVKSKPGPMPDNLPNSVRNILCGCKVAPGQKLTLTHDDVGILLHVTDVDSPGVVTLHTEVSVMWLPA
jgi:hypothetical protein